jgi:excisionase family DNA binding protein
MLNDRFLTLAETADLFGVSASYVRQRIYAHEWPNFKIGRNILFDREEITALVLEKSRRPAIGA